MNAVDAARAPGADAIVAVVVTHESGSSIDACLARLRAAPGVAGIRVVDNGSSDDTLAVVQRHAVADARLRFIANPDNPGFATACNQGAADSSEPWLAFVNPDCLVERDTFQSLLAHSRALGGEALLGADLVDLSGVRDGAARRNDPDFAAMLRGPLDAGSGRPLDVAVDERLALQPVDAVSGALMLLPRTLFTRIGGFDAGYRLHVEDLDLCRRAREAGAVVAVANDVRVLHLRGVSARSRPGFVEWHKHRGLWRYFRRFEAPARGPMVRVGVWLAVWLHWLSRQPRILAEALRTGGR
ncbi:glycosyltransferase family 2 protein [Luteimonas granuli]|uniref:Glycosyltransferase family 2 protein n=1 Tax=Luteimonas granuli TaxID=1176533 RepID=A0A518N5C7_9GAMM|nr:glycosyltransferase family 2 protein [Luteimonas granuli]QDW67116.1 glycosyltransferase family 2 protein [Luteimonas granuli]